MTHCWLLFLIYFCNNNCYPFLYLHAPKFSHVEYAKNLVHRYQYFSFKRVITNFQSSHCSSYDFIVFGLLLLNIINLSCFLINPKRADYWVSQNRKYCDFCKCWITDNKPSVDFHEKGRRHQENVKKRLRNISRHSTQVQKDTDRFDATLRQMESAALEAYRKDVENNADLTSVAINSKLQENNWSLSASSSGGGVTKLWNEHRTRDGKSYYVNIMTKETVWKPPKEGFASVEEQREQSLLEAQKQLKELEKFKRKEALMTMQQVKQEEAEAKARLAREKLKERRVADDLAPATCGPLLEPGKTDPYGRWETVKESPMVDLQLPQQQEYYEPPVEYEPEPPVKEFKEKTVKSLDNDEETASETTIFKKRKIGGGAKRNTRQRLDDD